MYHHLLLLFNWVLLANMYLLTRFIEINIAIIVGCMPAFAHFVSLHIKGSGFIRSLRSRLIGSGGNQGESSNAASNNSPVHLKTFGSNQKPRRNRYQEMSDTLLLETQPTIYGDASDGDQQSKHEATVNTTERMV